MYRPRSTVLLSLVFCAVLCGSCHGRMVHRASPAGLDHDDYSSAVRAHCAALRLFPEDVLTASTSTSRRTDARGPMAVLTAPQVEAVLSAASVLDKLPELVEDAPLHIRHIAEAVQSGTVHEFDLVVETHKSQYRRVRLAVSAGGAIKVLGVKSHGSRPIPIEHDFPTPDPMDQDAWRLITQSQLSNCTDWNVWDHCQAGTLQIGPWITYALTTQRTLGDPMPMHDSVWVGTHNSYNARGDGYGLADNILGAYVRAYTNNSMDWILANQEFSMTDQLNLGVRFVEIDPHWFAGMIRLCHAGGLQIPIIDELIQKIEEEYNITIDWDTAQLGCAPWDRSYVSGLNEIVAWMNATENLNEVIILYLDTDSELEEWGKLDLLLDPLLEAFGDTIFTPLDRLQYFPNSMPSRNQLRAMGKRVIIANNFQYSAPYNETLFAHFWGSQDSVHFNFVYPSCDGYTPEVNLSRILCDTTIYGPFFNGPAGHGVVNETNLPMLYECGTVFPCADTTSPYLLQYAVWSWNLTQPSSHSAGENCAAHTRSNMRWVSEKCTSMLHFACQSTSNDFDWVISSKAGPWSAGADACPQGYAFSAPTNKPRNDALADALSSAPTSIHAVWINHLAA